MTELVFSDWANVFFLLIHILFIVLLNSIVSNIKFKVSFCKCSSNVTLHQFDLVSVHLKTMNMVFGVT